MHARFAHTSISTVSTPLLQIIDTPLLHVYTSVGVDATGAFTDVGHSEDAVQLRDKYLIGVVGSVSSPGTAARRWVQSVERNTARFILGAFIAF